jgi:uncharacterized membrane protein YeaQ/YmgE (transglycosylase-associated protein family)
MKFKPILIVVAVFFIVNMIMGFVGDFIPSLGNTWIDWFITAFVNGAIFIWVWKFLKGKFGS